jgi:ribonuclease HI
MLVAVTDEIDSSTGPRTSQRAELLAASLGIKLLAVSCEANEESASEGETKSWVIATDSKYVVKGIVKWFPAWKVRKLMDLTIICD